MKYLDSNIFILPVLFEGKKAEFAKTILKDMVVGKLQCATSTLTLDEVIWIIMKLKDRKKALEVGKDILELPNLKILDVSGEDLILAIGLMEKYDNLKPRDAVHLSVSLNSGIFTIITDDEDFNNIDEINKEGLG